MNHNSFPSGEQAPVQQDSGDVAEFPSFEEHMQSMAQNAAEVNTQTLTRPSMKNEELPNGAQYLAHEMTEVSQKVKSGEPLNGEDITSLARACGFGQGFEKLSDFLDETGIDSGSDFDVKLPGQIITADGKLRKTPLSVSFRNSEGDFTRVDISRKDNGRPLVHSASGEAEEGFDVGYSGPQKIQPKLRNSKFMTSE